MALQTPGGWACRSAGLLFNSLEYILRDGSFRQHEHILAGAGTESEYVFVHHFDIPAGGNGLLIHSRPIRTLEVKQIRFDLSDAIAIFVSLLDISELERSVLL